MSVISPVVPPRVALPPKARAIVYYSYVGVGLLLGATQVGYSAAELGQPTWLTVALAVFAFLAAGLGLTAASNTIVDPPLYEPAPPAGRFVDADGDGQPDYAPSNN